jgi:hypothetical protein
MLAQFAPIDFNLLPFSPQEANAIKDWLQKSRAGQQVNGTTVVDRYWREILAAAQLANTCKSFEAIPLKRNRLGQELRRIATARKPKNIPINSAVIAALAFGASRLGLITYPRTTSGFRLRKKLFELSHTQINKSAAQAIKEPLLRGGATKTPLLSSDKGGRPSKDALNNYVAAICNIYTQASGAQITVKRPDGGNSKQKLALDFICLCIPEKTFGAIPKTLIRKVVMHVI